MPEPSYQIDVRPLLEDEGGGYLATVPELPGCMSDGATKGKARANVQDAIAAWIEAAEDLGRPVQEPARQVG